MPDLLVRLYDLPPLEPAIRAVAVRGVAIRRALAPEKHLITEWVAETFSKAWASECDVAFQRQPVACFIAVHGEEILGFAAYDAACRNFFGPIGVLPTFRGQSLGKALLLASLDSMHHAGYAYAIIGAAGPAVFFQKSVGAIVIENSSPGIYRGMLRGTSEV
jgi:ribosomal protein S18 acetylase RimI-like enzyme